MELLSKSFEIKYLNIFLKLKMTHPNLACTIHSAGRRECFYLAYAPAPLMVRSDLMA